MWTSELHTAMNSISKETRDEKIKAIGTTLANMRKIAGGHATPGLGLALKIQEAFHSVTIESFLEARRRRLAIGFLGRGNRVKSEHLANT